MYDNLGYPKEIQFSNGNKTRYVYLPDGTKLKTTHITAVDGIVVPLSNTVELADYQIINRDSTEYFGDIIYENGIVRRYIYDGGYVSVAYYSPSDVSYLSYHHYVKDHLGNIRAVVNDSGSVEQTSHYYPSGAIISDISTGQSLQPNKYNGKELDRMHGLDWYDYGARNYDAQILSWDRMDPLCEKFYHLSPYVYCGGNPILCVDSDGKYFETAWDIVNLALGVKSLSDNLRKGNYVDAAVDGVGILFDAAAVAFPGVPGAAGTAIKAKRTANNYNAYRKAQFLKNTKRGRINEAKVLKDKKLSKNKVKLKDKETGVKTIPDAITKDAIIEVKDTKVLNFTSQIRAQRNLAKDNGKKVYYIYWKKYKNQSNNKR